MTKIIHAVKSRLDVLSRYLQVVEVKIGTSRWAERSDVRGFMLQSRATEASSRRPKRCGRWMPR